MTIVFYREPVDSIDTVQISKLTSYEQLSSLHRWPLFTVLRKQQCSHHLKLMRCRPISDRSEDEAVAADADAP